MWKFCLPNNLALGFFSLFYIPSSFLIPTEAGNISTENLPSIQRSIQFVPWNFSLLIQALKSSSCATYKPWSWWKFIQAYFRNISTFNLLILPLAVKTWYYVKWNMGHEEVHWWNIQGVTKKLVIFVRAEGHIVLRTCIVSGKVPPYLHKQEIEGPLLSAP